MFLAVGEVLFELVGNFVFELLSVFLPHQPKSTRRAVSLLLLSLGLAALGLWVSAEVILERPRIFFRADNAKWPDTVELTLTLPPALEQAHPAEEVRQAVADELECQEREARAEAKARGWRILGAARVRRLSPYRRATSFELLRDRNPTFAVGRGQRKVFFQAVAELRAFRRAYRQALERWRAGRRSVVFPEGTWGMCQVHGVAGQT